MKLEPVIALVCCLVCSPVHIGLATVDSQVRHVRTQVVSVSAYTASIAECGKADAVTASGVIATEGRTIAADHLPFGTVVRIGGHDYVVEDRFGGGYHDRIDIYMEDVEQALEFGYQELVVEIVDKE